MRNKSYLEAGILAPAAMTKSYLTTLKRTVRIIAVMIGLAAALGIPATFGFIGYQDEQARLSFRTDLAARRLAEYAHVQGDNWRFSLHRLADFVASYRISEHQSVYDARHHLLTEVGPPVEWPAMRVAAPIIVRGDAVGAVRAEVSLLPVLTEIGLFAIIGIFFGVTVFFCAYFIPMRTLRAAITEHEAVRRDLLSQIAQTQAAARLARQATAAKSSFLAMMSHEIRTPMNAVIGLSSALIESKLDSDQRQLVDTIAESGNDLLRLINDILDFSKFDAGKVKLEALPFSPAVLVDHVASMMEAKAVEQGLRFEFSVDADMPTAMIGDQARMQQVLLNLMGNAVKFTAVGRVVIKARCLGETADAATIEFAVSDTGIGIAADQIGRLFNEFVQADSSIGRRFGGTGLGLVISKQIVEQMGGRIEVQSAVGVGTTFTVTVTLPKADAQTLAQAAAPQPCDTGSAWLADRERPLRLLLAEDNTTNQLVFSKLVQGLNIELIIAENGRAALALAQAATFDAVLMDMRMPEMDGLEATRAIRALGGDWSRIPILALTANAFPEDVKACIDAGMNDFLAKPLRKTVLIDRLGRVLEASARPLPGGTMPAGAGAGAEGISALPAPPAASPVPAWTAEPDTAPVLDHAVLDELIDAIGTDGARATLSVFLAETTTRLDLLRRLSCETERPRIEDAAHALKGAAGALGLRQLSALALRLEQSALAMTPDEYAAIVGRLGTCFGSARREAECAVKKLGRAAA
ncbi:MAG: ATP-binding protein [Xanthobacteraceae bacterium]